MYSLGALCSFYNIYSALYRSKKKKKKLEDTLCSEAPLCEIFPTLYGLAVTKGAKVADV